MFTKSLGPSILAPKKRGSILTTVSASTTLISDPYLVVPLEANSVYYIPINLIYTNTTTGGIRWGLLGPTGAKVFNAALATAGTAIDGSGAQLTTSATNIGTSQAAVIVTTTNAGNLTLLWAQNSAAGVLTLEAASNLVPIKMI